MIQRFLGLILLVFLALFAEFVIRDRFFPRRPGVEHVALQRPAPSSRKDAGVRSPNVFKLNNRRLTSPSFLLEDPTTEFDSEVDSSPRPVNSFEVILPRAPRLLLSPREKLKADLLRQVRVQALGPDLYEVNTADVRSVLENADRVFADLWPTVEAEISLQTRLQYSISSAAGDGVLTSHGFIVTNPKLTAPAGIQSGDIILSVNGYPVSGLIGAYRIYRAVRQDSTRRIVEILLDRRGSQLTKIYRIR